MPERMLEFKMVSWFSESHLRIRRHFRLNAFKISP